MASNYLASVSKAQALDAVTEAVSKQAAAPLAKLQKGELVAQAQALMAGRRWLPSLLRATAARADNASA
jgi:ParB family chromosome partitioning protein